MKLTEADRTVLTFLSRADYRTPAEIGWALPPKRGRSLKAQGAGRVGSSLAVRLMKRGLVSNASWRRDGHPAYSITQAGITALSSKE